MSTCTEPDNGKHERLDTHITYTTPTHMREPTLTHTHTMSVSALNDKQQIAEKDQNTHTHTHKHTHTHTHTEQLLLSAVLYLTEYGVTMRDVLECSYL